eukprot:SAG31_NODE_9320_length_1298_cov_1.751460_2_plen_165_part_00
MLRRATLEYWFSVDQLIRILECVPENARVEVLVTLHRRVVDPERIEIGKLLPQPEAMAQCRHRLGQLGCLNPYIPDGVYSNLDLSRTEDYNLANILMQVKFCKLCATHDSSLVFICALLGSFAVGSRGRRRVHRRQTQALYVQQIWSCQTTSIYCLARRCATAR